VDASKDGGGKLKKCFVRPEVTKFAPNKSHDRDVQPSLLLGPACGADVYIHIRGFVGSPLAAVLSLPEEASAPSSAMTIRVDFWLN